MSAVLSDAETKFFASRGAEVDASLAPPTEPAPEVTPPAEPAATAAAPAAAAPEGAAPAVPPAAAAAPATVPPPEPAQQVPLAALHEERRRRAEAEQTARQLQQQFEQLQAAMRQAQQPQAPDPEQDPMGYLAFQNQQLQQQLAELGQWRQQTEQQRQQVQQYQGFVQAVASSEAAFRQTHADYDQAAQYAMQFEDKRLQAFYPDPATRQRVLQMEAANMLQQAMQQGRDPAEVLYQAARNMGYAGPAAAGAAAAAAPPAAAPVAPVPSDAADKIRKGLAQQSTVAAGGSTPPGEMTPEALAAISDPAEFNKQWGKVFKRR